MPAAAAVKSAQVRTLMRRRLAALFEDVDVLAWPTIPAAAPPLEAPLVQLPSGTLSADQANVRGAGLANLTGIPAISVPVGLDEDSMPVALQLQAAWGRDELLLDAAEALERANGRRWVEARAPLATPGRRRPEPVAAIEVERLERAFGEVLAVQGVDLEVAEGEIYGFLGPNGAGKTTTVRMLTTLLLPTGGSATVGGHDVVKEARAVRRAIGVALQEAALDPLMTGRELIRLQATLQGIPTGRGPSPRRRPARAGRPRRGGRPPRRRVLGRDAAAARPRGGPGPRAPRPLPRRADHGPRPGQPQNDLGGGAGAQRRGHDGLPHHPVPGGGRPARRQRRDHRQGPDGRRGHPRLAQGVDRQPPHPPDPRGGDDRRRRAGLRRRSAACCRRPTAKRSWSRSRTAPPTSRASCGRSTTPGSRSARWSWSTPPSTTSSSPPPGTTSRRVRREKEPVES